MKTSSKKIQYAYLTVITLLIIFLYFEVFQDLVHEWFNNPDYSHGFIIPVVALYMVWGTRDTLKTTPTNPSNWGFLILIIGAVGFIAGYIGAEHFLQRTSFLIVIMGTVVSLAGLNFARIIIVPVLFLVFMIPLPAIIWKDFAFSLKLFATGVAVYFMDALGMAVLRQGNVIHLPGTVLEVVDACSGLRSLVSLLAMSVIIAYYSALMSWKKWVLILSAIPIAITSNIIRLIITALLTQRVGLQVTEGVYHSLSGLFTFILGLGMFFVVYRILSLRMSKVVANHEE